MHTAFSQLCFSKFILKQNLNLRKQKFPCAKIANPPRLQRMRFSDKIIKVVAQFFIGEKS